ncbi:MAG: hypothetical protein L0Z70_02090, partial [Chloroflexi bacterium]|nr:hypothetical protein [Chloroflexota bacterium]
MSIAPIPPHPPRRRNWLLILFFAMLLLAILVGAAGLAYYFFGLPSFFTVFPATPAAQPAAQPISESPEAKQLSHSEITFRVEIPENSPSDQPVFLNILDEVSGLAFRSEAYIMQADDDRHFSLTLPLVYGAMVQYRYSRGAAAAPVEEHLSDGRQMRYRLLHVSGERVIEDFVSRWTDTPFTGPTGRIMGIARDAITSQPIPNLLIVAGGMQTISTSDGSYLLEGLPPGLHNLVAYSLDGAYRTFQQGALVAAESTTPADLPLAPANLVHVTFKIKSPEGTIPAVPIRLAGSFYQTGNTFADLSGGVNAIAARMPILALQPDGSYLLEMNLPAGGYLRYFYTLGDGLWNAEMSVDGEKYLRQLIVPNDDLVVEDTIAAWTRSDWLSLTFDVTTPANTPPEDIVAIQFNPLFGWTEPIPMWRLSENRWAYVLYASPQMVGGLRYRYCRNYQCGLADDLATPGTEHEGRQIPFPEGAAQTMKDAIEAWAWMDAYPPAPQPAPVNAALRADGFAAGLHYAPLFHPSWTALSRPMASRAVSQGSNWVILSPTWTYTRMQPPILEAFTGVDASWLDMADLIPVYRQAGLNVALMPTPRFSLPVERWWQDSVRDFPWWVVWFERYRGFILHHADLAARADAQALILGGEWVLPALPGGVLADGSPSGVPADAEMRWRALIEEVRARYSGALVWAIPHQAATTPPRFLDAVDQIYLLFSPPLTQTNTPDFASLESEAGRLLDASVGSLQARFGKPAWIGLSYAAYDGATLACLHSPEGGCLPAALPFSGADIPTAALDLGEQADIYN